MVALELASNRVLQKSILIGNIHMIQRGIHLLLEIPEMAKLLMQMVH